MVPIFGWLWATGRPEAALAVFLAAAITDLLDGFVARRLGQTSTLGALLDPLADKLLVLVALVVGMTVGAVPWWLALGVIARDVVLAAGALGIWLKARARHPPEAWRPTRIGKHAMFFQSASIVLAIVQGAFGIVALGPYVQAVMVVAMALTLLAGAQYARRAARALWGPAEASPRGEGR